jgi:hypothetical protein
MITAIYELGSYDAPNQVVLWTDITNYVMASGDFNIMFNNYDGTMKETQFNITVSSEWDIPYYIKDKPLRIKQDGKVHFYGYVKNIVDRQSNDYETDLVVCSVLDRLNVPVTWFGDYTGTLPYLTTYPVTFSDECKAMETGKLIKWQFLRYTPWGGNGMPPGHVRVDCDTTALTNWCPELLHEPLYSAGSDIAGASSVKGMKGIYTWKEVIERICYLGFILIWDCNNERFKFIYTGRKNDGITQTNYPAPSDAVTYKLDIETLNMKRTMSITSKWCSNWDLYSDPSGLMTGDRSMNSDTIFSLTTSSSNNQLDLDDNVSLIFVSPDRTAPMFSYPASYWNRFSLELDFYTSTMDMIDDIAGATNDYTCFFNVSSCDARLIDGRYFTVLQLFDITGTQTYLARDEEVAEYEQLMNMEM